MTTKMQQIIEQVRAGDTRAFYRSRTWRNFRLMILERDNYECQVCKEEGGYHRGNIVHHVIPLEDRPDLGFDPDNLITVCGACHNVLHPEKLSTEESAKRERITEEKW